MKAHITLPITALFICLSTSANSAIILNFEIDNPDVIATPTGNIVFYGSIYNDINSEILSGLDEELPNHVLSFNTLSSLFNGASPNYILKNYAYDEGKLGSETLRS